MPWDEIRTEHSHARHRDRVEAFSVTWVVEVRGAGIRGLLDRLVPALQAVDTRVQDLEAQVDGEVAHRCSLVSVMVHNVYSNNFSGICILDRLSFNHDSSAFF